MKIFLLAFLFTLGLSDSTSTKRVEDYSWVLEEINEELVVAPEIVLKNTIQVYDVEGNLLGNYSADEVIQNDLPLSDLRKVMNSEFLFEYDGISYYLNG